MTIQDAFSLLAKPLRDAIAERGFRRPTEPQSAAIPLILEGKNVLLIAPTASGKTEAAILPVLSNFVMNAERAPGIAILYVSPLRALNRDLLERLQWWCRKLDISVAVRHGDTEVKERSRQANFPPSLLITTPETLQAILTGKRMKKHLRQVRYVIVDEVHELAEDKRGSQLALALERLRWITMRDFQLIGLSATIGTPEIVAKFLVGTSRSAEVVRVPVARRMRIDVICPEPEPKDNEIATQLYTHPEVAARLRVMRRLIQEHDSVLLFTNTRAIAEILASRFKVWDLDFPISIHHGSLAKPARISAERGLKNGDLKGLIATSSLELGIDIGRVDYVIQYMSPRQVTRLIQRIGRSGHGVGKMADGIVIAMDSDDTLEAMVIARRTMAEDLEPVSIPEKPLDVLTHQIVGLMTQKSRWYFREILDLFRNAYPYRDLTEQELEAVLNYMHSRFPRLAWVSFQDKVVLRPRRLKDPYSYYFDKLSMIPDIRQYLVIDESTETPVGLLDEAFVAEYGSPGTKFIVQGRSWKMVSLRGDKIYVKPVTDPTGSIPSWMGEEIPVPFEIAQEVGKIRRIAVEMIKSGENGRTIASRLSREYPAPTLTILRALSETFMQLDQGQAIPTDRTVTLEDWEDYVIISAHFGSMVNRTLGMMLAHILSEEAGMTFGIQQDPYRIVLWTSGVADSHRVAQLLKGLTDDEASQLIRQAVVKSGLFKRRLVHVARRFGALSRWVDLGSLSLRQLMRGFEGTVVFEEALKETFEKDLDLPNTLRVLSHIRDGEIEIVILRADHEPSPISRIGIERISRKTDLIPPEKMKRILIESTKARILNEVKTLACISCWQYAHIERVGDLPKTLKCPHCKSPLAVLDLAEEDIARLAGKNKRNLSRQDQKILERAHDSAKLTAKYGKMAALALSGKRIEPADAEKILRHNRGLSDSFFESIMKTEREALKRRFL